MARLNKLMSQGNVVAVCQNESRLRIFYDVAGPPLRIRRIEHDTDFPRLKDAENGYHNRHVVIEYDNHRCVTATAFFQHHMRDTISSFVQPVIGQRVSGSLDRQPVGVQGDDFLKTIRHRLLEVSNVAYASPQRLLSPRRGSLLGNLLAG